MMQPLMLLMAENVASRGLGGDDWTTEEACGPRRWVWKATSSSCFAADVERREEGEGEACKR